MGELFKFHGLLMRQNVLTLELVQELVISLLALLSSSEALRFEI